MKILAIDYGKKKIGLASSEGPSASSGLKLVTGLGSIRVNSLSEAVSEVSKVIEKEEIKKVIIGLAESGESRKMALRFIQEIEGIKPPLASLASGGGIEVERVDETLTTHQAKAQIREMGGGDEDERAAMIILENYLENLRL